MNWMKSGAALLGGWVMSVAAIGAGPLEGTWGGDQLRIVVDAKGAAIQGDCADGTIAGPITLTAAGRFAAAGSYEQRKGGPQRADQRAAPSGASYVGEVAGDVMTLTIVPEGATAQTFTLRRGAAIKLHRCL